MAAGCPAAAEPPDQVKKQCRDGRKGSNKRHQWDFVIQDPCSIDLSVLQSHQAPSPILVIDLPVLLFHHAPSPILGIDLSVLLFHQTPSPLLAIALPGRARPGAGGNGTQNQTHLSLGLEVAHQCQHAGQKRLYAGDHKIQSISASVCGSSLSS